MLNPVNESSDVIVRHSIGVGPHISVYFNQIKKFLKETKHEFLFLKFREEFDITDSQREYFVDLILSNFGEYMITQKDMDSWFDLKTLTFGDLIKFSNKKRIFLTIEPIDDKRNVIKSYIEDKSLQKKYDKPASYYGFFYFQEFMHDEYYNVHTIKMMNNSISNDPRLINNNCIDKKNPDDILKIFQWIMTPAGEADIKVIMFVLTGLNSINIKEMNNWLYHDQF